MFCATCLAMALKDKLQERLHSVTAPLTLEIVVNASKRLPDNHRLICVSGQVKRSGKNTISNVLRATWAMLPLERRYPYAPADLPRQEESLAAHCTGHPAIHE